MSETFIIKKTHDESFFKRFEKDSQIHRDIFIENARCEGERAVILQCMCINDTDMIAEIVYKENYYSAREKEIRDKAIDEFAEQIERTFLGVHIDELYWEYTLKDIVDICRETAEKMKEVKE